MTDFLFLSLCRNFKERNLDEFNKNLSSFEAHTDDLPPNEKILVSAFLARVMHGQMLDVFFEEDEKVFPLMSAAKIWSELKEKVEDESLVENMSILLIVQSVAVCLENGSNASRVFQWCEKNLDFPSGLRIKLATVVTQKDNYHSLIRSSATTAFWRPLRYSWMHFWKRIPLIIFLRLFKQTADVTDC
ncbi:hypothetical protein WMY93_030692 [Mugilogobius chulae]|uniref:Uncharacterized protein n=1 Tax=Mugilogobius chulae TaxID=88201 RepID=A0AAW0MRD6_9GOBI